KYAKEYERVLGNMARVITQVRRPVQARGHSPATSPRSVLGLILGLRALHGWRCPPSGGQPGAQQDQHERDITARSQALVQHEYAENRRNGRIDVRDDGRA